MSGVMLLEQVRWFARYNGWANTHLGKAVGALPESDYRADMGLFFGSIHATLNHLLVGDQIWLERLGAPAPAVLPTSLDQIVEDDRDKLLALRERTDALIVAFVDALDEQRLAAGVSYANMAGERDQRPCAALIAHVFNHQTHHRGQIHAALTRLGRSAPALDVIYYLRESA